MHRLAATSAFVLLMAGAPPHAAGQLATANERGVAMGHLHYVVRDVEADTRFWVALGGDARTVGDTVVVTFPDVLVLLDQGESSGGTEGSILNHMAFRVQSLDDVAAAGIALEPLGSAGGIANVYSPGGERIELFDETATNLTFTRADGGADPVTRRHNEPLAGPIRAHHLHLYLLEDAVAEAQRWYASLFGGVPACAGATTRSICPASTSTSPTTRRRRRAHQGRMLDHIGFEVENLERFCRALEARGVTFDVPYRPQPRGHRLRPADRPLGHVHRPHGGPARVVGPQRAAAACQRPRAAAISRRAAVRRPGLWLTK